MLAFVPKCPRYGNKMISCKMPNKWKNRAPRTVHSGNTFQTTRFFAKLLLGFWQSKCPGGAPSRIWAILPGSLFGVPGKHANATRFWKGVVWHRSGVSISKTCSINISMTKNGQERVCPNCLARGTGRPGGGQRPPNCPNNNNLIRCSAVTCPQKQVLVEELRPSHKPTDFPGLIPS